MLSSVLRSERAVAVNILIMRTFVQLPGTRNDTTELGHRMDSLERRVDIHGPVRQEVLKALTALERPAPQTHRDIGFRPKT